ncbi:hypothetical protein Tco_0742366 [Tanacetum coccineum]
MILQRPRDDLPFGDIPYCGNDLCCERDLSNLSCLARTLLCLARWSLAGEFSALEFKEFSLSLWDVFVVFFAEVLDVHPGCGIWRFFFVCSFCDGGHNASCISHHAHSDKGGYSGVEYFVLVPSEFVEGPCTRKQTSLILSWELIPRLDSSVRAEYLLGLPYLSAQDMAVIFGIQSYPSLLK